MITLHLTIFVATFIMIIIGNVQDSGKYTCELDSDDDDPLSVTHTLQILGMGIMQLIIMAVVILLVMIINIIKI